MVTFAATPWEDLFEKLKDQKENSIEKIRR